MIRAVRRTVMSPSGDPRMEWTLRFVGWDSRLVSQPYAASRQATGRCGDRKAASRPAASRATLGSTGHLDVRVGNVETVDGGRLVDQDDRAKVILSSMTAFGPIGTRCGFGRF